MGTPDPPDPKPEESGDQANDVGNRLTRRQLARVWAVAVAGISAASAVLINIEKIGEFGVRQYKRIFPDPTPTPTPRPLRQAVLHFARIGARDVTLAQVAALSRRPLDDNYPPERHSWRGLVTDYRVEFQGLHNQRCTVHWSLFNDANALVSDSYWKTVDAAAWPNEAWIPETTNSDVQEGDVWIPYVAPGTFHIALVVKDARN
jgi:hypothetical protein